METKKRRREAFFVLFCYYCKRNLLWRKTTGCKNKANAMRSDRNSFRSFRRTWGVNIWERHKHLSGCSRVLFPLIQVRFAGQVTCCDGFLVRFCVGWMAMVGSMVEACQIKPSDSFCFILEVQLIRKRFHSPQVCSTESLKNYSGWWSKADMTAFWSLHESTPTMYHWWILNCTRDLRLYQAKCIAICCSTSYISNSA